MKSREESCSFSTCIEHFSQKFSIIFVALVKSQLKIRVMKLWKFDCITKTTKDIKVAEMTKKDQTSHTYEAHFGPEFLLNLNLTQQVLTRSIFFMERRRVFFRKTPNNRRNSRNSSGPWAFYSSPKTSTKDGGQTNPEKKILRESVSDRIYVTSQLKRERKRERKSKTRGLLGV